MTEVIWAYLVWRYLRGITWTLAWIFAFWAPALIPVPVIGWFVPPLLLWLGIVSHQRRVDRADDAAFIRAQELAGADSPHH